MEHKKVYSKCINLNLINVIFSYEVLCNKAMRSQICSRILLVSFIVWFIILLFAARHLSSLKSGYGIGQNAISEGNKNRLEAALNKLHVLQQHSEHLKAVFETLNNAEENDSVNEILKSAEKVVTPFEEKIDVKSLYNSPSLGYETLRKRIQDDAQEFWFYISSQLEKLKGDIKRTSPELTEKINNILKMTAEHKLSLMKDINGLSKEDGFSSWRKSESASLAAELEKRLKLLQNPEDCTTAKKLICNLNKGCGFGCQIHHAAYCLIVAYASKRTLILTSKGWRYHKSGWEDIFLPLSDTCRSPSGASRVGWPGQSDSQVVVLPIIDTLFPRPEFLPPAIPKDLAPRLIKLHSQPLAWWIGQMLRYLMRPQPSTEKFFNESINKLNFKKPIVGVHIRRTDKIGTEADFHSIEEYMKHVGDWFDQQIQNGVEINRRRIYLATDDPKVIFEAKNKYPDYDVIGDPDVAKTAGMSTRYSDNSLFGILLDIHLLSLSDHLVCTFSSQVCRVAYEIMQTYDLDATTHFTSLDDVYYYGGQNAHSSVAVLPHEPMNSNEIELKVGDKIIVAGNHWDGYSKGRNLRTNKEGLYPSFKVQNRVKVVDFPVNDGGLTF
ncbi:alpha-(1,6)-fucosyltransferase, putative [Pediculus humanus corporis]|uniref:Alpha-(1,6)-fucosyltransferase n=1 Tax=Pediculus humanus subsp. corporis TaxID=121224 RepID=E0VR47_PEDHC|nr:alpha-(1,6)-fucosyltransferase, putative [Pediculus humanus corporis]EEB15853.1 alpha-(1,6)-fucosyltransferase, putative [Pediculus humanus corporis]